MKKCAGFVACLLILVGCGPSEAEKRSIFVARCKAATFTADQCLFLLMLKEDADETSSGSSAASGIAIGLAVGSSIASGRR